MSSKSTPNEQARVQRYDIFLKNVFKRSIASFLSILNLLVPRSIGNRIISELPEETAKGILRADLIVKTDTNNIIIFEFKKKIKINAYFAIAAYTSVHIHTNNAYMDLLTRSEKTGSIFLPYVPVIIGFSIQKGYYKHLLQYNIARKTAIDGVYMISLSPYYNAYMFILEKMNLTTVIQRFTRTHKSLKKYAKILNEVGEVEFWRRARTDTLYRDAALELIKHFGELVLLTKFDVNYFSEAYRFANLYTPSVAKNILDLAVIVFMKRVDEFMSLAEVLTQEEKKKIIETFGIEVAIETFGIERVIDAVGIEKVIDAVGIEKVISAVGIEKVIDAIGIEKVIDAVGIERVIDVLAKKLKLTEEEKEELLEKYRKRSAT